MDKILTKQEKRKIYETYINRKATAEETIAVLDRIIYYIAETIIDGETLTVSGASAELEDSFCWLSELYDDNSKYVKALFNLLAKEKHYIKKTLQKNEWGDTIYIILPKYYIEKSQLIVECAKNKIEEEEFINSAAKALSAGQNKEDNKEK